MKQLLIKFKVDRDDSILILNIDLELDIYFY
eukprot:SAG31_NODE_6261_length_2098_cov_1.548274_1_plen_31_part_00